MIKHEKLHGWKLISHIWDYYRLPILGGVAALAVAVYALVGLFTPKKSTALTLVFIGTNREPDDIKGLLAGFEKENLNMEQEELAVECPLDMEEASAQSTASYIQILNARFLAGEIDLVFAGKEELDYIAGNGVFLDPQEYLTEEEEEALSSDILRKEDTEGNRTGYGILLKESTLFTDAGFLDEDAAVGIASGSQDPEMAHWLIEYLFGFPYDESGL